jgi:hypothetical protein
MRKEDRYVELVFDSKNALENFIRELGNSKNLKGELISPKEYSLVVRSSVARKMGVNLIKIGK